MIAAALAGRLLRRAPSRPCRIADQVHDAGDPALRRLHRQRRRAVADARRSTTLPDDRRSTFRTEPERLPALPARPGDAGAAVGDPRHARPRAPHRRPREAGRHRQRQLRPGQPRADGRAARREGRAHRRRHPADSRSHGDAGRRAAGRRLGRTYGAITAAVRRCARSRGRRSATSTCATSTRCPTNLGDVLARFKQACSCPS